MSWLQTADTAVFRFINQTLSNPVFDLLMPLLAGVVWFVPVVAVLGIYLVWKGGLRGRLFVAMLALLILLGDTLVINRIKKAVGRERPSNALADARVSPEVGRGGSGSMPSSHASTWAAAALIAFAFYPRSRRFMVPMAGLMAFSRVYLGVHYPSDALAGLVLGAGYAAFGLWTLSAFWRWAGPKWFPEWWRLVPSIIVREDVHLAFPLREMMGAPNALRPLEDRQYLILGYIIIVGLLSLRLFYVASDKIELSEGEALQWLWSKHQVLSFTGVPPGIVLLQSLSSQLWGDTHLGVRFFPPILGAVFGIVVMRFVARETGGQPALALMLAMSAAPLFSGGSVLMTPGTPLVLCSTLSMFAGWRAIQTGAAAHWGWTGFWGGLALLFDYGALLLLPGWAVFLLLWRPARASLRQPGPWLALGIMALCSAPLLIPLWQPGQLGFASTPGATATNSTRETALWNFIRFTAIEIALLNPIFLGGIVWAAVSLWRIRRDPRTPALWLYFFSLGAPVFLGCWILSLLSPAPLQCIALAAVPLFCLMMARWNRLYRSGVESVKVWVVTGIAFGAVAVVFLHDTDLLRKAFKFNLPPSVEPLRPVREIQAMADEVARARSEQHRTGHESFIIATEGGLASQIAFYLPQARAGLPTHPLVYPLESVKRQRPFSAWPEYRYTVSRKGQDAILVMASQGPVPPPEILSQFESVTDLGQREIKRGRRTFHTLRLFACRNLL